MPRTDRRPDQLRPLSFTRGYTGAAPLFLAMQRVYGFEIINANRSPQPIARDLRARIEPILGLQPSVPLEPILATP